MEYNTLYTFFIARELFIVVLLCLVMIRKLNTNRFLSILVVFLLVLGLSEVFANWSAPTSTPTNNNTTGPIDNSSIPQAKGGNPIGGSLLDINGTLSSENMFVWGDSRFYGDVRVGGLSGSGTRPVCVDSNHKFYICGATPPPPPAGNISSIGANQGWDNIGCSVWEGTANLSAPATQSGNAIVRFDYTMQQYPFSSGQETIWFQFNQGDTSSVVDWTTGAEHLPNCNDTAITSNVCIEDEGPFTFDPSVPHC